MKLLYLLPTALFSDPPPEETEAAPGLFSGNTMLLIAALIAIFYFVLIAPEKKQRRKREEMLGALKKGDKIMTTSGMYGAVAQVQEDVVTVQAADGVRLRFSRAAIQTVLTDEGAEGKDKAKEKEKEPEKAKA